MTEHYTPETLEKGARAVGDAFTHQTGGRLVRQADRVAIARTVLDAVAGDLKAEALEAAADALEDFIEAQRQHGKAAEAWYDGADEAVELLLDRAARLREGGDRG